MEMTKTVKKSKFSLSSLLFEEQPVATTSSVIATQVPIAAFIQTPTQVDPQIKESLKTAMEENALGSYDYLKFKKSSDTLKAIVPDESARFKAAFVAAQTLNITKEKLVETANHYIAVLAEEQRKFNEVIDGATKQKIGSATQRIKEITDEVASKTAAIQKLTSEISVLQQEGSTLQGKVSEDKKKIDAATSSFTVTYDTFVQEIKSDIGKMQSYL